MERVDQEINRVLGEPWTELCRQNEGYVAKHTIVVLALVLADPLMPTFTAEERNMLKWASLLHDIAKLSTPAIRGKDHIHPFKSAKIVLDVFERYNFIPDLHKNYEQMKASLDTIKRLVDESVQPIRSRSIE